VRCKKHNPSKDDVGRVTHEKCNDVNPGTWHLAIVNHLGSAHRSFVIDSTFDYEVWNYPVYAYEYHYFNPQTLEVGKQLYGSAVPIERFTIDKFRKYRNPLAKSIVGVAMDLTYAIPMQPTRRLTTKNRYHTVRYVYDLELDAKGNILGGEWYSNFHPDFMWTPPLGSRALSNPEKKRQKPLVWSGKGAVSDAVHKAAQSASSRGQPVAVVVERLVKLASGAKDNADSDSHSDSDSERGSSRGTQRGSRRGSERSSDRSSDRGSLRGSHRGSESEG
jgi:hypothetical protein